MKTKSIEIVKKKLELLIAQARNSPMSEQTRLIEPIKKLSHRYKLLTGEDYSISKEWTRQENMRVDRAHEVVNYLWHGHKLQDNAKFWATGKVGD